MTQLYDCYKILEVEIGASKDDITSAYKRLCWQYHPDVNGDSALEEKMKQINIAYAFLRGKWDANEKARDAAKGAAVNSDGMFAAHYVVDKYFSALMNGNYERAYSLLSDYDKRYVTLACFCEWRKSVEQLFDTLDYSVTERGVCATVALKDGGRLPGRKYSVTVTEKNKITGHLQGDEITKLTVFERGAWHIFLGYRDLNTIVQGLKDMFGESVHAEMERVWQQWRLDNSEEPGVLSVGGFCKSARNELYAYKRHDRPFVIAVLSVAFPAHSAQKSIIMRKASETVRASLRETDLIARAGEGELLILFAEMKKRYAGAITKRLAAKVEGGLRAAFGTAVSVGFAFTAHTGDSLHGEVAALLKEIKEKV